MNKLIILAMLCSVVSCTSLLPEKETIHTNYKSFDEVKYKFDLIQPGKTSYSELVKVGFDPYSSNNVTIQTYTDVLHRFMPDNIAPKDLPPGVRDCIEMKEKCFPFIVEYDREFKERKGNAAADLFGFNQETEITGWTFIAFFIIINDQVVYKLFGGEPNHYKYERETKPLGPLQTLGESAIKSSF